MFGQKRSVLPRCWLALTITAAVRGAWMACARHMYYAREISEITVAARQFINRHSPRVANAIADRRNENDKATHTCYRHQRDKLTCPRRWRADSNNRTSRLSTAPALPIPGFPLADLIGQRVDLNTVFSVLRLLTRHDSPVCCGVNAIFIRSTPVKLARRFQPLFQMPLGLHRPFVIGPVPHCMQVL